MKLVNYPKLPPLRKIPEIWLKRGVKHPFSTKFPEFLFHVATWGKLMEQAGDLDAAASLRERIMKFARKDELPGEDILIKFYSPANDGRFVFRV